MVAGIDLNAVLSTTNTSTITGGNNTIIGGDGDDIIISYGNDNIVEGNEGNDIIISVGNHNNITGANGNDVIISDGDYNTIHGGNGNDAIVSVEKAATNGLYGEAGDDLIAHGPYSYVKSTLQKIMGEITIGGGGRGAWGDPHYEVTGANGQSIKFDHKGVAGETYNVFSGDNIRIEGLYAPYGNAPCVITKSTIKAGNDVVTFNKDGAATLNGTRVQNGTYTLADGTKIVVNGKKMSVTPSDGTGVVEIYAEGGSMTVDPSGQFKNLGGILGTAIKDSRALSEAEANAFNVKNETAVTQTTNPFNDDTLSLLTGLFGLR